MEKSKSFWKLAVLIAAILVTSCSYDEGNDTPSTNAERIMKDDGQNPDETVFRNIPFARAFRGYVYIEGNEPALNFIHIYEHDQDGQLTYLGKVSSGGAGNGSFLGSQGALVLSPDKKILYAVNAGSNSISSFEVGDDGMLTLLNTTNSLGQTPVSLAIHNDWLYAVHLGNGTINGFYVNEDGNFTEIPNSEQKLSDDVAGPAKIAFSPNGNWIYVTEKKTDKISIFPVNQSGVAGMPIVKSTDGGTPSGFEFARNNYIIVANGNQALPGAGSLTSYGGINVGTLSDVNGEIPDNQTMAGWVAITQNGRFAYVSNYLTDNLSSYNVGVGGNLSLAIPQIRSGNGPSDLVVSSHNFNVFVLCAKGGTIERYARTPQGGLAHLGGIGGVPTSAAGMANW